LILITVCIHLLGNTGVNLSKPKKEVYLTKLRVYILQFSIHTYPNLDNLSLPKYNAYFNKASHHVLQQLSQDIVLSLKTNQSSFTRTIYLLILHVIMRLPQMLKRLRPCKPLNRLAMSTLMAKLGEKNEI